MSKIKLYMAVSLAYSFIVAGNNRIPDGEQSDCNYEAAALNTARIIMARKLPYNADKELNKRIVKASKRCHYRNLNHIGIFCMVLNFLPFVTILAENDTIIKDILQKVRDSMLEKLSDVDSGLILATIPDADEYIKKIFNAI